MYEKIVDNINKRIAAQHDSRCASPDEVRICWLVAEVERLRALVDVDADMMKRFCVDECGQRVADECVSFCVSKGTIGCKDYNNFRKLLGIKDTPIPPEPDAETFRLRTERYIHAHDTCECPNMIASTCEVSKSCNCRVCNSIECTALRATIEEE